VLKDVAKETHEQKNVVGKSLCASIRVWIYKTERDTEALKFERCKSMENICVPQIGLGGVHQRMFLFVFESALTFPQHHWVEVMMGEGARTTTYNFFNQSTIRSGKL